MVPRRGRVADYVVSVVGLVPLVLGSPQALRSVNDNWSSTAVYRTDLLGQVEAHVEEIHQVLGSLAASTPLADFAFIEGPDHAPYAEAYAWEVVEVEVAELPPPRYSDFDAPDVWQ